MKNYQKLISQSLITCTIATILLKLFNVIDDWISILIPLIMYLLFMIVVAFGLVLREILKQFINYIKQL